MFIEDFQHLFGKKCRNVQKKRCTFDVISKLHQNCIKSESCFLSIFSHILRKILPELHKYLFQYIFLDFSHVSIFSFTIPPYKCSVISLLVFECYGGEDYLHNLHQVGVFIRTFQARHKMKHRYRRRLDKLTMFQSGENSPN